MTNRLTLARVLATVIAGGLALGADTEPVAPKPAPDNSSVEISTDRPDFTESTDIVPRGTVQLEGGLLMSRHALVSGSSHALGGPFPLVRVGLSRFAELRWGSDGFTSESLSGAEREERHAGASDFQVGIKARLWGEKKYVPAIAVIAALSVPAGAQYFTSGDRDPLIDLCWSKSLPGGFDAGGNLNFRWESDAEDERGASLTIGKRLQHGFRTYGEIYRISPIANDEAAHWIANTGITRLLGPRAQVDIEVGHTIGASTPYWFAGAGFAVRISALPIARAAGRAKAELLKRRP